MTCNTVHCKSHIFTAIKEKKAMMTEVIILDSLLANTGTQKSLFAEIFVPLQIQVF